MTQLSVFFKALADPTRLRIINLLLHSPLCVCEMARILKLPQPLLSRHLAYLRNNGLIEGFRQGLRINYELNQRHPLVPLFRPFLEEAFHAQAAAQMDLTNLKADAALQEDKLA